VIDAPSIDWSAIAPEMTLASGAMIVLLVGLVRGAMGTRLAGAVSLLTLLGALGTTIANFDGSGIGALSGQIDADSLAGVARMLAIASGFVTVAWALWARPDDGRHGEHLALVLLAVCGMGLFGAAGSLLSLFVGLELFSIALYALCALEAERGSALEAGFKYLVLGGVASAVLLYGTALVYGVSGSFDLSTIGEKGLDGPLAIAGVSMVLVALAFKASAAPFHWWAPDVYDGAPTSITAFMATATKAAAFVALVRVCIVAFPSMESVWQPAIAAIATTSIVVGNFGALAQQSLKRLLAFSSVAQAGYLLIGLVAWRELGIASLVYALVVYVAMSLGAFGVVLVRERELGRNVMLDDLTGTAWAGRWAAVTALAMALAMLSLAGIPPTGGFFAKFGLFAGAVQADYAWLAVVGALGSVVSLAYYLRVVLVTYRLPEGGVTIPWKPSPFLATVAICASIVALALGLAPNAMLDRGCTVRQDMLLTSDASLSCGLHRDVETTAAPTASANADQGTPAASNP
jgi:NADH-quinone oxidoreductase subunit N